ncbi:Translation initiation factor eIF-2B subunit beta [Strongyloides ratti]|uniref:Translation initiation factor eIF2B subunit beta n=1 Tax=Strongyloides ratti TaxID=34506 RepID=A0A090L2W0_STRRB|nr:Translation initiation factor eIF-2B subunit beta [Strongyloides ratti]CEF64047.1 Translation initiation factor eIF-2B subunit beta [Strongyloides ratti]
MSSTERNADVILQAHRDKFLWKLENLPQRDSTFQLAKETLNYLRRVVLIGKYDNIESAVAVLREEGSLIYAANKSEFVVRNMVLFVLKMMRDEWYRLKWGVDALCNPYDSLNKLWLSDNDNKKKVSAAALKKGTIASIKEFIEEMNNCSDNMCKQASDHILGGDTIITLKLNEAHTLKEFILAARKVNKGFHILQVSDKDEVCDLGGETISSCDVFRAMCVATRVVISACAILPDGSCICQAGTLNLCLAAKSYSVPVLVICAFYKLTPKFIPNSENCQFENCPLNVLDAKDIEKYENINVVNPAFDLIPANLVSLYITSTSAVKSAHVYRLIGEYYHPEDLYDSSW